MDHSNVQFFIDSEAGLEKYWFANSQPQQNFRWKLRDPLLLFCLLLPLIVINRETGLIQYTFVDRFYREIFFRQELQLCFDDGMLTCCGFKCRFYGFERNCGGLPS
jgi:hypothetical protein